MEYITERQTYSAYIQRIEVSPSLFARDCRYRLNFSEGQRQNAKPLTKASGA